MQAAPVERAASQARPQPPQLTVVVTSVSQPSRSGAAVRQSARPGWHP